MTRRIFTYNNICRKYTTLIYIYKYLLYIFYANIFHLVLNNWWPPPSLTFCDLQVLRITNIKIPRQLSHSILHTLNYYLTIHVQIPYFARVTGRVRHRALHAMFISGGNETNSVIIIIRERRWCPRDLWWHIIMSSSLCTHVLFTDNTVERSDRTSCFPIDVPSACYCTVILQPRVCENQTI